MVILFIYNFTMCPFFYPYMFQFDPLSWKKGVSYKMSWRKGVSCKIPIFTSISFSCYGTPLFQEFSLAQWLWYWLFNQAALVQILSKPYISAMHLFISFFITNFVVRWGLVRDMPLSH